MHTNVSSPILKARRKQRRLTKRRIFMYLVISPCLLLLGFVLFLGEGLLNAQLPTAMRGRTNHGHFPFELVFWPPNSWPPNSSHAGTIYPHRPHSIVVPSFKTLDLLDFPMIKPIPARSLTALLPVTSQSISNLEAIILTFLRSPGQLH
jgi:hypothetical protein